MLEIAIDHALRETEFCLYRVRDGKEQVMPFTIPHMAWRNEAFKDFVREKVKK